MPRDAISGARGRGRTAAPRRARTPDGEARGAILAATERLLAERALHELSVTDIAEAAGTSRGIVYFYFAGKSAILAALAESVCEEMVTIWRDWFDGRGGIDEAEIRRNLVLVVQLWTQHRSILHSVVESFRLDPEVGAVWTQAMNRMIDEISHRIARERADGRPVGGTTDPTALAELLVWSTERIHYVALSGLTRGLGEPQPMVDAMTDMWLRLLRN